VKVARKVVVLKKPDIAIKFEARMFMFYEKATGRVLFEMLSEENGMFNVETAANLLAMNCVVRNQRPEKCAVAIIPRQDIFENVAKMSEQLVAKALLVGRDTVRLSTRQTEVLDLVLQNLSNKELAYRLNLTERTIKFHVSRLLAKFHCANRFALQLEVMNKVVQSGRV